MDGIGEIISNAVSMIFWAVFILALVMFGGVTYDVLKLDGAVSQLNRYQQVEAGLPTTYTNTNVTTSTDVTYVDTLLTAMGVPTSYVTSISTILTSANLPNSGTKLITTKLCYAVPLTLYAAKWISFPAQTGCLTQASPREAP